MERPTNFNRMGPITKYLNAKDYLDMHNIPQMFQGLIASLMMEKPENPVQFLDTKLEAIKQMGPEDIDWESFIYPLHPSRDPLRNELIRTDDQEAEKIKGQDPFADKPVVFDSEKPKEQDPIENDPVIDENYKPELFNLTEPQDDDDDEEDYGNNE